MHPELQKWQAKWEETQPAAEYTTLSPGEYKCGVDPDPAYTKLRKASTGNMYLQVCFVVAEGDRSGDRLYWRLYFTEKALAMTRRDLEKLGLTLQDIDEKLPPIQGRYIVHVEQYEDGGRMRARPWQFTSEAV